MRTIRRVALALTLIGPAVFTACRSSNAYDVANSQTGDVVLVVENQSFYDVDVYALSSGLPTRIGTVSGAIRGAVRPESDDHGCGRLPVGRDAPSAETDRRRVVHC